MIAMYIIGTIAVVFGLMIGMIGLTDVTSSLVANTLFFGGIFILLVKFVYNSDRKSKARAQFLLMTQDEAQKEIDMIESPQERIKMAKYWRTHHTSTKL